MRTFIIALALLTGCTQNTVPIGITYKSDYKHLVIVAPPQFVAELDPYVQLKREEGYIVTVKSSWKALGPELTALPPDYVFIVGDLSLVPTVYHCTGDLAPDIFAKTCIYSDTWLVDRPIGRLLASSVYDVRNYVLKAYAYHGRAGAHSAYMVNDRVYQDNDGVVLNLARQLTDFGIKAPVGAVNYEKNTYIDDGVEEASSKSVSAAVDRQVDFIQFYGHGSANGWGYLNNIPYGTLSFHEGRTIPLVMAMACETVRNGPNPPWYNYQAVDGSVVSFTPDAWANGPVPESLIPDPSGTQYSVLLSDTIAHHFTSSSAGGAMVYIGETVVTNPKFDILNRFYAALGNAYWEQVTIGEIWKKAVDGTAHPEYWEIIGDPSTWYVGEGWF